MKRTFTYKLNIFLFLLPALVLFIGILIAPIAMSVYYSLYDFNSIPSSNSSADMEYVGIDNYKTLFSKTFTNPETGKVRDNTDRYLGQALINALIPSILLEYSPIAKTSFLSLSSLK